MDRNYTPNGIIVTTKIWLLAYLSLCYCSQSSAIYVEKVLEISGLFSEISRCFSISEISWNFVRIYGRRTIERNGSKQGIYSQPAKIRNDM